MKNYLLSLIVLLYISPSFAQEPNQSDVNLMNDVVGTWQHVSSTDYQGNILRYERKIQLFADGTGICTKKVENQTIEIPFYWNVEHGNIMLYVENKKGKRINTDSQFVWDIDNFNMSLACTWESDDYLATTSTYKRLKEDQAEF